MNYTYTGKIYKNCDPSGAQKAALSSAQSMAQILQGSYETVFGAGSSIFNSLKAGYDKIIQTVHGKSAEELAAENSQIINQAAASSKQVQQAIGERAATTGVVPGVESGVVQAERAAADTAILNKASAQKLAVTAEDYAIGREERDRAMAAEGKLTGEAFAPAEGFAGQTTKAIGVESEQANANAAASTSWMGLVGGLADAAVGGLVPKA